MPPQRSQKPLPDVSPDIPRLLERLGITRWDVLIVGDGSGTGWKDACGWSHIVIDRLTRQRKLLKGGMDGASVNIAEMMPTLHGLTWYHNTIGRDRLQQTGTISVHIVSDSRVTVEHGTIAADLQQPLAETNELFWSGVRNWQRRGYILKFHWLPRSTTDLNKAADLIASMARRAVMAADARDLTNDQIIRIRRTYASALQAVNNPAGDHRQSLSVTLNALQTLLDLIGSDADRTARSIETVQLTDPDSHQPIDLGLITPDADQTRPAR